MSLWVAQSFWKLNTYFIRKLCIKQSQALTDIQLLDSQTLEVTNQYTQCILYLIKVLVHFTTCSSQPFIKFVIFSDVSDNKMSSQKNPDWRMLGHDLIFQEIMMMVGLDSLESLHRCRQVCTAWNSMIMQNIWERKSKRNIIKMRIQKIWASKKLPSDKALPMPSG